MATKSERVMMRLEPEQLSALDRAARADARERSALARKIVIDWLHERSWLAAPEDFLEAEEWHAHRASKK